MLHLLTTKQNGVEIQTYMAIIACLLILIHTGRAPTKRTFEMICLYMSGWASQDELERHIEKLEAAKKYVTLATFRAGVFAAARSVKRPLPTSPNLVSDSRPTTEFATIPSEQPQLQ